MSTFFNNRTLTISSQLIKHLWKKPSIHPKLTIQGKWFNNAGFEIGEKVNVQIHQKKIIITKL